MPTRRFKRIALAQLLQSQNKSDRFQASFTLCRQQVLAIALE